MIAVDGNKWQIYLKKLLLINYCHNARLFVINFPPNSLRFYFFNLSPPICHVPKHRYVFIYLLFLLDMLTQQLVLDERPLITTFIPIETNNYLHYFFYQTYFHNYCNHYKIIMILVCISFFNSLPCFAWACATCFNNAFRSFKWR